MNELDYILFASSIKKLNKSRIHKVKNSYGVYDGFKYYRKNRPKEHKYVLTESQYFSIIRKVNEYLKDKLINGEDIVFPERLGKLEIRKYKSIIDLVDGKIKTNLPIDWDKTIKLWYEDKESYNNKTIIRINEDEIYKVYYNRNVANFTNKSFYKFKINREIKRQLKENIKNGNIEAFTYK